MKDTHPNSHNPRQNHLIAALSEDAYDRLLQL